MSNVSPYAAKDTGGIADKIDLIIDAYSQLRISGVTVQATPEDLEVALSRMENMFAEWQEGRNICVNYNFEHVPCPNSVSGVKRAYWQAASTNLASRLIPDFNKQVPRELLAQAAQSFSTMSGAVASARLNQVSYPSRMPVGSGNELKYNRWQRFYKLSDDGTNTCNIVDMFKGDVNDYTEHFDAYLDDDCEFIESFSIVADSGLVIESSEHTDTDVMYRLKAVGGSEANLNTTRQVTIIITTSNDRVETRYALYRIFSTDGITNGL